MNKKLISFISLVFIALAFVACSDEGPKQPSIFPTKPVNRNNFEQWLLKNYTYPYNVEVQYKLVDGETDINYTLSPADSAKSAQLAIIIKYLWFDAYNEVAGPELVKQSAPRVLQMVGSSAFTRQQTEVVGTAEGGYKVTLYRVNSLTKETIYNYDWLNFYFFHTMHHEFTHILNQKKPYDDAFAQITSTTYVSGDWYQLKEDDCLKEGYISTYARSEAREDFAELLSFYVTDTPTKWNERLQRAGTKGASLINQKMAIIKSYMQNSWNINLDDLRDSVLRRGKNLRNIDLEHLN